MVLRGQFNRSTSWQLHWRIDDAPLVYLDLETTGLHPERGQRIVEVALVDDGGLQFHRRSNESGFGGEKEHRLLKTVSERLEDLVVVGHNILFDLRFIAQRCERHELRTPDVGFIDTLRLARKHLETRDHRLGSVAQHLKIELPEQLHRADVDVRLARSVFETLVEHEALETLEDVDTQRFRISTDEF